MIDRMWAISKILWKAVSSHLFLWLTGSEWHCAFCERQSHHIFSCDQQEVSDIAHFVKGSLITFCPLTNSLWVTLHILWKAISSHLFLWPTASEWHDCTFCERQSDMTNSLWVTLHILWNEIASHLFSLWVTFHILQKAVSLHLVLYSIASEWHCTFCERQPHDPSHLSYDQCHEPKTGVTTQDSIA